ncbi:M48 family metallopeptidase [Halopiger xanaduensis]|uniref:Peptidase M48 Ste24p n=1 Tax=Halopiger xanaduensis (strain DSM 18323 / JCM 14033 / SH-6) TaxID=797210 RepID=F8D3C5_HALXS|nr:peptidase M48 Ste24p [Halopiger xanaduensis SH-6]
MAAATVIAGLGLAILLPLEILGVGAMVIIFLTIVPMVGTAFLLFYGVWVVIAGIYRRVMPGPLVVGRIAHDGMADAVESVASTVARPAADVSLCQFAGAVAGLITWYAGLVVVTHGATPRPLPTVLVIAVLVGVVFAVYHTGRTIYDELRRGGTVQRQLEADVDTVGSTDSSEQEREQASADELQSRVDRLARQVDVPAPTVRLGRAQRPIAATTGLRSDASTIVVSRGLVETLEDLELEAVLAHEISHVVNRDAAVLTLLSMPAVKIDAMLEEVDDQGSEEADPQSALRHPSVVFAGLFVAALNRWAVAVVARYREYVADRGAVAITGDPAALAGALEKLDAELENRPSSDLRNHSSTAAFSIVPPPWEEHRFFDRTRRFIDRTIFGTHPPTEKRIERLRARA